MKKLLKIILADYKTTFLLLGPPVLFIIYIDNTYFGLAYKYLGQGAYTHGKHDYIWMGVSIAVSLFCIIALYSRAKKINKLLVNGERIEGRIKEKQRLWYLGVNILVIKYSYKGCAYEYGLKVNMNKSDNFVKGQSISLAIDPNKPESPLIKDIFT